MDQDLILQIENLIGTMNPNQQSIARDLTLSPDFSFGKMKGHIIIQNRITREKFVFSDFVRSKCNCG